MSCEDTIRRLDDYVDGELPEAEFQEVELHLAGCPACREAEERLRRLLASAAGLRRASAPARDLWPGVAERIGQRPVLPRLARPNRRWAVGGLAAAAAVVFAVWAVGRRGGSAIDATAPPAAVALTPAGLADVSLAELEGDYARATEALLATLNAQRDQLAPETVRNVEENLQTIDRALNEIRAAIRKDPGNPQLARVLRSTHQRKVDLLRRVVRLSRV